MDMELVYIGLLSVLYALPSLTARFKNHSSQITIAIVNTLFGWTGIGWILALHWAVTSE
jgi:uncharacterized membrane protein